MTGSVAVLECRLRNQKKGTLVMAEFSKAIVDGGVSLPEGQLETRPSQQEIERKFRVNLLSLPFDLNNYPAKQILQGYLAISESGNEVRIRDKAGQYFLTCKSDGALTRSEAEIQISEQQFNELWPLTEGRRVEKLRYEIEYQGLTVEIDVFAGSLSGLVLAEIEFKSEQASQKFNPPLWLQNEVTRDRRYKNKNLALNAVVPHS